MSYKNDNILGKKVILFGTNTRQISSLEQVLLYAGADVVTFTDTIKGRQQIPISQADVIIFDDSAIPNAVEVVRSIKTKMINSHAAWLIIHNTYTADVYQPLFADNNIAYVPKNIYDVAEVLKGLSSLMKQKPSPTNEIKLDLQSQSPPSVSPSHEVRVMIFEDDPLLQNILSLNLKRANINFQISASGQNFKSLIEAYKPTVVLLDLTLDGLNGLQILELMRHDIASANLPIVIFTNSGDDDVREKTVALGVKDFLIKANTNFNDLVTLLVTRSNQQNVNNPQF